MPPFVASAGSEFNGGMRTNAKNCGNLRKTGVKKPPSKHRKVLIFNRIRNPILLAFILHAVRQARQKRLQHMNTQAVTESRAKSPNAKARTSKKGSTPLVIHPATQPSNGSKEIFFELDASSAKEVLLAGDFTGWEKTPIKLQKEDRGKWRTKVVLAPGRYHYKFLVDGAWQDDPRARARSADPFGGNNCVLEIT
jgi:hypothetical protein